MKWAESCFEKLYAIPSRNGLTRPSKVRGEGYKMINMGELFAHDRIGAVEMELVPMNEKELSSCLVQQEDLLFARQSLVLAGAGKCSIVKEIYEPTTFESHIIRVRLDKTIADPYFYYYYFKSPTCRIRSIVTQGVQAGIRGNDLKSLKVHLPPISVQQKIASILSAYDDLIENNLRRIALLEESARLLYKEWFVHLRFPGYEHTSIVDGVPEGWKRKTMDDVCKSVGGGTPSTKKTEYWENGKITWVTPTDITRNNCLVLLDSAKKITEEGLKNSSAKILPPETILMTSRASIGFFALIDKEVCTNQGFISIIPNKENLRMYLLYNLLNRKDEILQRASGATYKEINKTTFRELKIIIPISNLLDRFYTFSYETIRQVRLLQKQNQKLKQARNLLLPRLMNGDIAV